jgi:2-dehydro-3-deoxy-D-gluconate 5-dehydrogenase
VSAAASAAELFSLEGRRIAVTGAGRGIGKALALGFAAAGADLLLIGRPNSQDQTLAEVQALDRPAAVIDLDLADADSVHRQGAALAQSEQIDVLVNNAGVIDRCDSLSIDPKAWAYVLDINLSGLFFLTQHIAGPMVARGAGKIINIASLLSFQGGLRVASYTASKHAVAGLTRAFANEWAAHGIQVNAIAPGYIITDNTRALRDDPERFSAISSRIPAGRWGETSDLIGAAIFLASRASDYVNGHILVVDGGWTAR